MRALAIALLLAGCHDLPDLGTCGNGIIEADNGEACDGDESGADTCTDTCELSCQTSAVDDRYVVVSPAGAEELFCPDAAMACGLDNICRASSGEFVAVGSAQSFDVKFATSGDVDADGIADLIGTSATQIVVRLGASGTAFADGFAQTAPSSDSPLVIFDRKPDMVSSDTSDIAIGVATDGFALLSSDTETFGPDLDLTFDADSAGQQLFVVRDPSGPLQGSDVVLSVARLGTLAVKRIAISPSHSELGLAPCGGVNSQLIAVALARDLASFVIVGKPTGSTTNFFVCRYAPVAGAFQVTLTGFNSVPPDADSAALAQLDDDPCPDLALTRKVPPNSVDILVAPAATGTCGFTANTVSTAGTIVGSDVLLGAGSIVPRAVGIERDELVMSSGVYQFELGVLTRVIGPTSDINPWTTAAVVDISGDGQLDVVAGRKGQDDVDIVRGGSVPNAYRADTTSSVIATTAGDFDGDGVGDVALIEQSGIGQRISILYGVRDGIVAAPVANSRFEGIVRVARLRRFIWLETTRGIDGFDDLVVVQTVGTGPSAMTRGGVLVGEAARLMTVPRIPPFASLASPEPIGVVAVAQFDGSKVLALALRPDDPAAPNGSTRLATNEIEPMNADVWVDTVTVEGFDIDTLRGLTVIKTSGAPRVAAFARPVAADPNATFGVIELGGAVCTSSVPGIASAIRPVDIDGDGVDELAVSVINGGGRVVHVIPATTSGASCSFGDEVFAGALGGCSDIARVGQHVVVLCGVGSGIGEPRRSGIFRVNQDGTREPDPAVAIDGIGIDFVAADFDGDGVPDLAVRVARGPEVSVQFIKQCPSHDVRSCK